MKNLIDNVSNEMNGKMIEPKKRKKKKLFKIMGITLLTIVVLFGSLFLYVSYNPGIIVGGIQKLLYGNSPINSFEPLQEPIETTKENGVYYVSDLKYADVYPNSFLDISYPNEDKTIDRPTLIYFHGGGYFAGSKSMGDPLAANNDSNYLYDKLVLEGYNLVNVDYALVPDHHFPVPVIQMNQAINYLVDHAEEFGLNMHNVVIMGGSAGAIMTAQYGAILSNSDYAKAFNFAESPKLTTDDVKALVVDDAPLDIPSFDNFSIKVLIGNYLDDSVFFNNKEIANQYNAINYINSDYPATFLTAGTDDGFPKDMQHMSDKLTEAGVDNLYFYPDINKYGKTKHGYMSNLKNDPEAAKDSYEAMVEFLNEHTNNKK